jgi:hypothetical protein
MTMRFMVIVKANKESESGALPDEKMLSAMGKFNEELVKAGVMLAGEGLHPSSKGVRINYGEGGKKTVVDGPFAETKELVAGYWLLQTKTKEECVEWIKRAPFLPDVPTVAEAGFSGTEGAVFNGLIAPAGTPEPVIRRLNEAVNQVLAEPAFAQRLGEMGLALIGGPPEAFGKQIAEETAKWRKVIQASGIPAPS